IQAKAGHTADIIMGTGIDAELGDKLCVTVVATGFKTELNEEIPTPVNKVVHLLSDSSSKQQEDIQQPKMNLKSAEEQLPNPEIEIAPELEPTLIVRDENSTSVDNSIEELEEEESQIEDESVEQSLVAIANQNNPINKNPEFEFEIKSEEEEPVQTKEKELEKEEPAPKIEPFDRSRERINELRRLSLKSNTPSGISDLEKEPAYRRRNIKLDNVPSSSESNVSRFTLSINEDEDDKPRFKSNNSYLHDRVD
ncbi:MAG TPA: hypothetical protein PKH65_06690, partial [Bacteroidia bacterium]|nr:hypothetical protein [Bacteroidia bacterium]